MLSQRIRQAGQFTVALIRLFRQPMAGVTALRALDAAHSAKCPFCAYEGTLMPVGRRPRPDARCPSCGSLERHRLLKLCMDENRGLIEGKTVLHFAPEPIIAKALREFRPARYVSADLFNEADLKLDITAIDLAEASFDTVVCNHVLEHVDDRKAIRELFRILKAGGTLLAMVPVVDGWEETFEPDSLKTPEERLTFLGHPGHLRIYGQDAASRFVAAGFQVTTFVADGWKSPQAALLRGERVFIASKPAGSAVAAS